MNLSDIINPKKYDRTSIVIPGKNTLAITNKHDLIREDVLFRVSPVIAPDGTKLYISLPANFEELKEAWEILYNYTVAVAPNRESAAQDIDKLSNVKKYFCGGELAYFPFVFKDVEGKIRGVIPAELLSIQDVLEENSELIQKVFKKDSEKIIGEFGAANGKVMGNIYQIAVDPKISKNYQDLSAETPMYKQVAFLLPRIAAYEKGNWAGVITESRKEGPELEAIINAGFGTQVPNEHYRPPAVQKEGIKSPRNKYTKDLVLLGKNVPDQLGLIASVGYVSYAYCERQGIERTLRLIRDYFATNPMNLGK